jgi:hypothetical protein
MKQTKFPIRTRVVVDKLAHVIGPSVTKLDPDPWFVCIDQLQEFIELPTGVYVFDLVIDTKPSRNAVKLEPRYNPKNIRVFQSRFASQSMMWFVDGERRWFLHSASEFLWSIYLKVERPIYARLEY